MNKEFSEKAVEILSAIQTGVESGVGFAKEQLPDIAQQYILYGRVNETVYMILLIISITILVKVAIGKLKVRDFQEVNGIAVSACGIVATILTLGVASKIPSLIMVWFAPKIWLITQIKSLIS